MQRELDVRLNEAVRARALSSSRVVRPSAAYFINELLADTAVQRAVGRAHLLQTVRDVIKFPDEAINDVGIGLARAMAADAVSATGKHPVFGVEFGTALLAGLGERDDRWAHRGACHSPPARTARAALDIIASAADKATLTGDRGSSHAFALVRTVRTLFELAQNQPANDAEAGGVARQAVRTAEHLIGRLEGAASTYPQALCEALRYAGEFEQTEEGGRRCPLELGRRTEASTRPAEADEGSEENDPAQGLPMAQRVLDTLAKSTARDPALSLAAAETLIKLGNKEAALRHVRRIVAPDRTSHVRKALRVRAANALCESDAAGDLRTAREVFLGVFESHAGNQEARAAALTGILEILGQKSDEDEARAILEKVTAAIVRDPQPTQRVRSLARLCGNRNPTCLSHAARIACELAQKDRSPEVRWAASRAALTAIRLRIVFADKALQENRELGTRVENTVIERLNDTSGRTEDALGLAMSWLNVRAALHRKDDSDGAADTSGGSGASPDRVLDAIQNALTRMASKSPSRLASWATKWVRTANLTPDHDESWATKVAAELVKPLLAALDRVRTHECRLAAGTLRLRVGSEIETGLEDLMQVVRRSSDAAQVAAAAQSLLAKREDLEVALASSHAAQTADLQSPSLDVGTIFDRLERVATRKRNRDAAFAAAVVYDAHGGSEEGPDLLPVMLARRSWPDSDVDVDPTALASVLTRCLEHPAVGDDKLLPLAMQLSRCEEPTPKEVGCEAMVDLLLDPEERDALTRLSLPMLRAAAPKPPAPVEDPWDLIPRYQLLLATANFSDDSDSRSDYVKLSYVDIDAREDLPAVENARAFQQRSGTFFEKLASLAGGDPLSSTERGVFHLQGAARSSALNQLAETADELEKLPEGSFDRGRILGTLVNAFHKCETAQTEALMATRPGFEGKSAVETMKLEEIVKPIAHGQVESAFNALRGVGAEVHGRSVLREMLAPVLGVSHLEGFRERVGKAADLQSLGQTLREVFDKLTVESLADALARSYETRSDHDLRARIAAAKADKVKPAELEAMKEEDRMARATRPITQNHVVGWISNLVGAGWYLPDAAKRWGYRIDDELCTLEPGPELWIHMLEELGYAAPPEDSKMPASSRPDGASGS